MKFFSIYIGHCERKKNQGNKMKMSKKKQNDKEIQRQDKMLLLLYRMKI